MPLSLMPLDEERAALLASGARDLLMGAPNADAVASFVRDAATAHLALYADTGAVAPWLGYLAWDGRGSVVGVCGFKGPCRDGAVEIAYATIPMFERKGWGGRMAAALVAMAFGRREVERVQAHTLAEPGASTRILEALKFRMVEAVADPDDGPVWRWALERPSPRGASSTSA